MRIFVSVMWPDTFPKKIDRTRNSKESLSQYWRQESYSRHANAVTEDKAIREPPAIDPDVLHQVYFNDIKADDYKKGSTNWQNGNTTLETLPRKPLELEASMQSSCKMWPHVCTPYLIATLLPSTTTGRRFSLSSSSCDGHSSRKESKEELEDEEDEEEEEQAKEDDKEEEANWEAVKPPCCSISVLVPSLTSSPRMSLMSASGPSFLSTSTTSSSEYPSFRANSTLVR